MADLAESASRLSTRRRDGVTERVAMTGDESPRLFTYSLVPDHPLSMGVVICPSLFEAKTMQPAEVEFGRRAAARGFPVLYIQPAGSGESEGDPTACTMDARVHAASVGQQLLGDLASVERTCFLGARLGAAVALRAAAVSPGSSLVMWDPALTGSTYLKQAKRLDRIAALAGGRAGYRAIEAQLQEQGWATLLGNVVTRDLYEELLTLGRPLQGRVRDSFIALLNRSAEGEVISAFESVLHKPYLYAVGKRDLGHLGFTVEDALTTIEPTLRWLEEVERTH